MNKVNFKIEKAVNGHILRSDICGVRVYEKKEDLCAFIASSLVNGIKLKDGIANISVDYLLKLYLADKRAIRYNLFHWVAPPRWQFVKEDAPIFIL